MPLNGPEDFKRFLTFIQNQDYYDGQIREVKDIPKREAQFGTLKEPLPPQLQAYLYNRKVRLWGHQARAINSIRSGHNTVVSTSTASGKSLIYNLSILSAMIQDPNSTALYLFPTKALSRDQQSVLQSMLDETNLGSENVGVYDGDTTKNEKRAIRRNANIIITNPSGLHFYIPWFKKIWKRFCKNLKYIVIDEIHTYKGIYGSSCALLMRRLKRVLACFNVKPIWILCSATINHPKAFAEKLIGEPFTVIDRDDSPSGPKKLILWDLPYREHSNRYLSPHQETRKLYKSHLEYGLQTLTFTTSRKMAELHAKWAKKGLQDHADRIECYRAGIGKNARRTVERSLKDGEVLGVSSTNALELGIDIGTLDATICSGFPRTITSFWQQIGRSGRGTSLSLSTLIPMKNPLDFFYVRNSDVLLSEEQTDVLISLSNQYLMKEHLCCAAHERPLKAEEYETFGFEDHSQFQMIIDELVEEGMLKEQGNTFSYKKDFPSDYPNKKFNLNHLSDKSYKVITTPGNKTLTVEDENYVFRDLHPGAVYLHQTVSYLVNKFDISDGKVYVTERDVDYHTQALKRTEISTSHIINQKDIGRNNNIAVSFCDVEVTNKYHSYNKINNETQEIEGK
ncbi:MAG: DEAD/DEAH box helicase, partial [Promethearchaeia archaeon]